MPCAATIPRLRAPTPDEQRELAAGLRQLADGWPRRLQPASCAETIDLRALGIAHNACVDGELIRRLCPRDAEVQRLCGPPSAPVQGSLLPLTGTNAPQGASPPRDGSQRTALSLPAQPGHRGVFHLPARLPLLLRQ